MTAPLVATLAVATALGCATVSRGLRRGEPGATQQGLASWYSPHLAGHRTASGERYDPHAMTAAHRHIPFGTWVAVSREGGRGPAVVVRINDRGPFGAGRIIDLSEAAARHLDMLGAGVVRVRIEVLGRRPPGAP